MTTTPPDPGSKKAIASPRQSEPPQTTAQPDESRRKKKKTESPAGNRSDRIEKLERERRGGGDKWEPHARHLAAWLLAAAPWRRGCRWAPATGAPGRSPSACFEDGEAEEADKPLSRIFKSCRSTTTALWLR